MVDRADHRIGDAERQQAIDLLRAHTGAGRLTLDEFSDLAGEVFAAKTYGELEAVGRKLPPGLLLPQRDGASSDTWSTSGSGTGSATAPGTRPPSAAEPAGTDRGRAAGAGVESATTRPPASTSAPGGGPAPGASTAAGRRCYVVAVMCGAHPRGRWRPAARLRAVAFWGGAHVDLRDAEFPGPVVDVTAWAVMGGVTITVPEGTPVELDGVVIMGGSYNATRRTDPAPDAPLVRVHARGMWGGVTVRNPRRRKHRDDPAARHGAGTDRSRDDVADRPVGLLELPQRILDDLDAVLHDGPYHHAPARRPGPAWSPPTPPRPGMPSTRGTPDMPPTAGTPDMPPTAGASAPAATPPPPSAPADAAPDLGATADHGASAASDATAAPQRPARSGATRPPTGTLTMMVTDVAESTRLAERLGDQRWIGVIAEHNALVREQVGRHGGTEVKALGDGFLVVFPSARRAILAAVDVQQALARFRDAHPETPVAVRVGLHTGEIVDVDGDVLGQNVVVASRIADQAAPGEIVVSGVTRDLTVSGGDITFGPPDDVELKGLSDRWRVHRVAWSPATPDAPAASAT